MISTTSVTVWFVCKACRGSFKKLDEFLEHKKQENFEEFKNTNCIIFEEREIQSINDQIIVSTLTTAQRIEDNNLNEYNTDQSKATFKNKDHCPNQKLPCSITFQNTGLIKTEHQSIDHDCDDDGLNKIIIISSETITAPITHSDFKIGSSLNSTHCASQNSIPNLSSADDDDDSFVNLKPFGFENTNTALLELMGSHHNPRVLLRRLKFQGISKNSSVSKNAKSQQIPGQNFTDPKVFLNTATAECAKYVGAVPFQCQLCLAKFSLNSELEIHVNACRSRFCAPCNITFSQKYNLKRHILKCHVAREHLLKRDLGPFKCHHLKCGKELATKSNLKRHLLSTHSDNKPFKCPVSNCEYKCNLQSNLRRHLISNIHTKD